MPPAAPFPGIVYSQADGNGLWIIQQDGTSKQLTDNINPVLSPDLKQILYTSAGDIWLMDLTTSKTLNLTHSNDKLECCAQWWPAHPGIIVFLFQNKKDVQPTTDFLGTVKTNGENYLILDGDIGLYSPPALSPDGQTIAFDRAGQPWIYSFTGGIMPLFPKKTAGDFQTAVHPAWSPDGHKLAWQFFGSQAGTNDWSETVVLDLDSYQITHLHHYTLHPDSSGYSRLAWSPDGKWLAVAGEPELGKEGKVSLWVLSPDGNEEHSLGVGDQPVWSPDGSMLAYVSGDAVFAVKPSDWNPFPITLPGGSVVLDWVKLA